ncbi:MAG TPA: replicative DNA helicase [Candidatus Limnocylindria bacterium]|nr:replicative DNA helicase [Candidatus Limnocylindria bacterium]
MGQPRPADAYARLSPQAIEAEQSVLGSILIDADAMLKVADFLRPADFYRKQHGDIFEAMLALHGQREPIDLVTLGDELERNGRLEPAGGPAYLTTLMNTVPTAVHVEHYGRIVERKAVLRNLIGAAGKIAAVGYEEANDAEVAIDRAESILFEISQHRTTGGFESLATLLGQAYDRLEYLHEHRGQILGIPSGLSQLDALLGGFQPSDLIILAARPSVGKTSLALNIAQHAAVREGKKVGVFSLEMSKEQLALRLLSAESGINPRPLQTGFVDETDWSKIAQVMNDMHAAPLWIDDSPGLTVMELRTKARRLEAEQHGLDLIIVDYLQLMQASTPTKDGNRVQEVSEISRGMKQLARELKVPVIGLSQLSRGVEQRGTAEPRLSDLRESGCLTADTRVLRADTGAEVELGALLASGERNIPVWSVDDRLRLVRRTMTHVFPSGTKPVFRMRLASGREVKASANHPFLTYDGWKPLEELEAGVRLAVPRRVPSPSEIRAWAREEVILLAHLLGDGCTLKNQPLHYTSGDPANLEAVEQAAAHFGVTARRVQQASWWHSYLPAPYRLTHGRRNPIAAWLDGLGVFGKRSYEKLLPADVFRLPDDQVQLFLRHLWATDGSISLGNAVPVRICYASTSQRLARDVQALLLRLKIRSRLRRAPAGRHRMGYTVDISGVDDQLRFLADVGVHGARGENAKRAQLILQGKRSNPNVDTIPLDVWRHVRLAANAHELSERELQAAVGTQYCGSTFYRHAPSRPRLAGLASLLESPELHEFATSDLFWDRIEAIEPLGEQPVYDATVLGTHNFIADGVVAHNSIEQDADVVLFLYRGEDQNAEAEVELVKAKVAKHRNGPIGEVPLQFRKANTRFYTVSAREEVPAY